MRKPLISENTPVFTQQAAWFALKQREKEWYSG